jgi:hypothetical protein
VSGPEDSDEAKKSKCRSGRIADQNQNPGDAAATDASGSEAEQSPPAKGKGKRSGKKGSTKARAPLLKAPDLPLPLVAPIAEKNLRDIAMVEPEIFNRQGVRSTLHCANRDHQPVHFEFHVSVSTVSGFVAYECMALTIFG